MATCAPPSHPDQRVNESLIFACKKLGLTHLKSQQEKALYSFLKGHDLFVSLPTGFGKSIIFQAAPFCCDFLQNHDTPHFAIIVMPLKALIQDQLDTVRNLGIDAEDISGGLTDEVREKISTGHFSLLFTSPEFLTGESGKEFLKSDYVQQRICGVFVDESHCVTKWGQSSGKTKAFRASYGDLGDIRSAIPRVPLVSLTATATKDIRGRIAESLGMHNYVLILASPDNPNLKHVVLKTRSQDIDLIFKFLIDELKEKRKNCDRVIVYCHSRKVVSELYALFSSEMPSSMHLFDMYHTNTESDVQESIIEDFAKDDGKIRVLFATIAFGMGVNVKGAHTCIIFGRPSDLDDYLQMAGRVGRDGNMCLSILIQKPGDVAGRVVSKSMDNFVRSNDCRRHTIRQNFGHSINVMPMHSCCDVCASKCSCDGVTCEATTPHFENIARQCMSAPSEVVSVELPIDIPSVDKVDKLQLSLQCLKDDLVRENPDFLYSGKDIASGLPDSTINKILKDVNVKLSRREFMKRYCFFSSNVARRAWDIYRSALGRSDFDTEATWFSDSAALDSALDYDSDEWSDDEFAEAVVGTDGESD